MKQVPVWLINDRTANALVNDGFIYYGCPYIPENMLSPEPVGNWYISPGCQEPTIEVCDRYGALFLRKYKLDFSDLDNAEYERVKSLLGASDEV
ncbi:hypothetical protein ACE1CD_15660 [Aerosakkonema sp. BLCC-F183]|uniref:hypothetical protein n=1 Tax=Aerosakkonema sp. BLCC-F183 TaxID=3342834 RepID=UPI0035B96713